VRSFILFVALITWGLCAHAEDRPVELHVDYLSQTATNVRGGDRELWRYADEIAFGATFDLQKILRAPDARFQVTLTDRNGRNLSLDGKLGSLQEVQGIYGRGQTWHWTQFSYQQTYLDGRLDWKIGRLVGGEDFAEFPCEFMNLSFCGPPPGNTSIRSWYNWPVSTWATRLKASFKGFGYVQVGAYEVNPRYLETRNGLNLGEPGGATGVMVPLEVGWQPTSGGTYKLGVWYDTSRAPDVGDSRMHNGSGGAYVNLLQPLPPTGLRLFFNATFNSRETSTLDSQIALGISYKDALGVAVGRTHLSNRLSRFGKDPLTPESEYVGELYYRVRLAHWIEVRPGIQFIHQRAGLPGNKDLVVAGMGVSAHF